MCDRDGGVVVVKRDCGAGLTVGTDCGDALCWACEPYRAAERRQRWSPVAEKMVQPMWTVFSLPNDREPGRGIKELMAARRRWLNIRLGERNKKRLLGECLEYAAKHFGAEGQEKVAKWVRSCRRFCVRLDGFEKSPRIYDLAGQGFGSLEVTYNAERDDFHPHLNIVADAAFIPWVVLVVTWGWASGGRGEVVYVHRLSNVPEDMKEVVKYVTKVWEIPVARQAELRQALRRVRRVWPIGAAAPVEVKRPCPCCGSENCRAHFAGRGEILERKMTSYGEAIRVRFGRGQEIGESWFVKWQGLWREPEPDSLNLILRELARHSETAPPEQVSLFAGRKEVSACPEK